MSAFADTDFEQRYPRQLDHEVGSLELRLMTPADADDVLALARRIPRHDLLFLPRDIQQPAVMKAWADGIDSGEIFSLVALLDGSIVGCSAVVRDRLSFSPHVGDLRVVLDPDVRARGLGRVFIQESFLLALATGLQKLTVRMTTDQERAMAVFEDMGFRVEALLRDHVRDGEAAAQDLAILGHDVERIRARRELYGIESVLDQP